MIRLAVILACHNRKSKTIVCLRSIDKSDTPPGLTIRIFVTDDGSIDGTAEAVAREFPSVTILSGDGNQYWNGGMRLAFQRAIDEDFDFYLWLNDDTEIYLDAIISAFACHELLVSQGAAGGIVVGSTRDRGGRQTYGGLVRKSKLRPLRFDLVAPGDKPRPCDTMNGNFVLISRYAVRALGNLDSAFRHSIGDIDYGLRATRAGISVWVMPRFAGECQNDHLISGSHLDPALPIRARMIKIMSPRGLPLKAWGVFCFRHAHLFALPCFLSPYFKTLVVGLRTRL